MSLKQGAAPPSVLRQGCLCACWAPGAARDQPLAWAKTLPPCLPGAFAAEAWGLEMLCAACPWEPWWG